MKIGDLCSWSKGYSVPRDETSPDKEVPYLHYGDLYKLYDFRLDLNDKFDEIIKIDYSEKIKFEQYLHDGDIVFALTSETVDDFGHCTMIINPDNSPFVSGMETTVIHVEDRDSVIPAYLNYLFQSLSFQRLLRQYITGMKVYRVHPRDIMDMKIQLPDMESQSKIVSVLDSYSDEILILSRINDNLVDYLQAEYDKYFIGDDIGDVKLGDISKIYSGGTPSTGNSTYWDGEYGWLSSGETRSSFIINTEKTITKQGVENSSTKLARKYDTVIASAGQGYTRGQTSMLFLDTYVNQSVIVVNSEPKYSNDIYCNLSRRYEELRNLSDSSSIRGSITTKIIADLEIPMCSEELLVEFNHVADSTLRLIENNLREIESLTKLRDFLLPRLMSGEIDVSNVEMPN